jgi:hypothetical protein
MTDVEDALRRQLHLVLSAAAAQQFVEARRLLEAFRQEFDASIKGLPEKQHFLERIVPETLSVLHRSIQTTLAAKTQITYALQQLSGARSYLQHQIPEPRHWTVDV